MILRVSYDNKSAYSVVVAAWICPQYAMRLVVYEVLAGTDMDIPPVRDKTRSLRSRPIRVS